MSENNLESQPNSTFETTQSIPENESTAEKHIDDVIDPIEELLKNNNVIPLLAVIDQVDLNRRV